MSSCTGVTAISFISRAASAKSLTKSLTGVPRTADAEICRDETAATAIGVLRRAVARFADHGVAVQRVLSDNGSA